MDEQGTNLDSLRVTMTRDQWVAVVQHLAMIWELTIEESEDEADEVAALLDSITSQTNIGPGAVIAIEA